MYLLNGETRTGKITEISDENLIYKANGREESIQRSEVLLVEYSNGKIEYFNIPEKDIAYNSNDNNGSKVISKSNIPLHQNQISINTLALCNADVAIFYEHLRPNKKIGYGVMGAYNFNLYVNAPNYYMYDLNNAKKNYDLGVFLNFYAGNPDKKTRLYYGAMIKYCLFHFNSVKGDSSNLVYTPATGYQLAPMLSFGSHSALTHNFFIKTLISFGAFVLHGEYKEQFNYARNNNQGSGNSNSNYNYSVLPKMYVGINLGFNF